LIIESLRLRNFRCFGDQAEVVTLEPGLTVFVGANGAGKTTIIAALQKLFGTRAEDRRLVREDVHFGPDEEPGVDEPAGVDNAGAEDAVSGDAVHDAPVADAAEADAAELVEAATPAHQEVAPRPARASSREIEIEVVISLPELAAAPGPNDAIPEVFRAMWVDGVGGTPRLRIRVEATWTYGVDEDDLSSRLYWITTLDPVPFGERDIAKVPFQPTDRRRIQVRYLPATRDSNAIIRQALRELLNWPERFGDWSGGREPMERQWNELQALFDNMPAIGFVTEELGRIWTRLFDGPHLRTPRLTVLAREVQRALRELSLTLGPGLAGRHRSVHDLSEGQSSLFYVALVATLIKLDEQLAIAVPAGFRDRSTLRPWLTILALEEPENHLAPFYLSRMVALMNELSRDVKGMGVLTTHSASALRRLKPQQVRHLRHEHASLLSRVRSIPLPPADQEDAQKFVQEGHPRRRPV
jgi:putative ATP-dependent endonuclease of the OLD family